MLNHRITIYYLSHYVNQGIEFHQWWYLFFYLQMSLHLMSYKNYYSIFLLDFVFCKNFPCIFAKYSLEGFSLKYGAFFHISVCILPSLIIIPIKMINNTVMTMIFFLINILIYLTTYPNLPIIPQTKNPG